MKKTILIIIILIGISHILSSSVFAQKAYSEKVPTRVGNPSTEAPGTVASSSIVQAAQDIKDGYAQCGGGYSYNSLNVSCMKNFLLSKGHPANLVNAFEQRRESSITDLGCSECLGYVATVLTLLSGDTDTLRYPYAAAVLDTHTFISGADVFQQLPSSTDPQPGDIAVTGIGTYGHIVIVKQPQGALFTALESNGNSTCQVTDFRTLIRSNYTFYRKI